MIHSSTDMKIVAIGGFFHDLNFAYHDGNITLAAEEERFSRIKMHPVLEASKTNPKNSLIFSNDF